MRRFLYRCFLACVLFVLMILGAVTVCGFLASSEPSFYAKAVAQPVDEAEIEEATNELERLRDSIEFFIQAGEADEEELKAVSRMANEMRNANHLSPNAIEQLERLTKAQEAGAMSDSFEVTLTERHLNAWLVKEIGDNGKEWRRPRIALEADNIRYAVTVDTPVGEAVLSCDFKLAKTKQSDLTLELHAVRCGKLPLPAATILKQFGMKIDLPPGVELDVQGDRPTLTFTQLSEDSELQVIEFEGVDGEIHLTLGRTSDADHSGT